MTRPAVVFAALGLWMGACLGAELPEMAFGDSIAVGLALPGDAKVGRSPRAVVEALSQTPLEQLRGHVVILSTGLSNDPNQLDYAALQLDMLQWAGAKVIVLGVGASVPRFQGLNDWLKAQAQARDMIFVYGWPDVHPASYGLLLRVIRSSECRLYRVCSI